MEDDFFDKIKVFAILIGFFFVYYIPARLAKESMKIEHKDNGVDVVCGMLGIIIYVLFMILYKTK